MLVTCPICGKRHDVSPSPGWNFVLCDVDHGVTVFVDGRGNVREVHGTKLAERGARLRFVPGMDDLAPTWIDVDRIRLVLDGTIPPSEEDEAAVRVLLRLGIVRYEEVE